MGERKFLRTFICLTLMLSILLGTFGAQAAERTVTILELTNDFVYIRSSTGENSQIIGTLRKGTRMFYRGRSGSMAYVCTSNGTQGYVYAGYLEKVGEARIGNIYYVQSSSLAVYRSASTSSGRSTTLSHNYYVLLTDANGRWGKIRSLNGGQCYVLLSGLKRASV